VKVDATAESPVCLLLNGWHINLESHIYMYVLSLFLDLMLQGGTEIAAPEIAVKYTHFPSNTVGGYPVPL
jgi:hypothetical protein